MGRPWKKAVVTGAVFGDEGKGKVVDDLAEAADFVIRYMGGGNAGHTVVIGDRSYALHLLPSGIFRAGLTNVVGPGVAFELKIGTHEIALAKAHGSTILLDMGAPVVLPIHRALDLGRELAARSQAIGTTKQGIGPTYGDFWMRRGVRLGDLRSESRVREALTRGGYWKEVLALGHFLDLDDCLAADSLSLGMDPMDLDATVRWCMQHADVVCGHLADTRAIIQEADHEGKRLLFEGAQGILLDTFQGTWPYCTSSLCTPAGVSATFGIYRFDRVIGITKAYATRVGAGPFPTELDDETGEQLRQRGHEFGTTTGRPRRCGWLDLPALRYACRMGGVTELIITKLDVLTGMNLFVATSYEEHDIRSSLTAEVMENAVPVYSSVPGWSQDITTAKQWSDLPLAARGFVGKIERETNVPVSGVSVGPERSQLIWT